MEEEVDLIDMIKYFWRKKVWIIVVGILSALLAIVYTKFLLKPKYNAVSTFILTNNVFETEADVYAYAKLPERYSAIADSNVVLDKVIKNLDLNINNSLSFKNDCIKVTNSPSNFLITVSVKTENAKKSAEIANELVKVTIEEIKSVYNDDNVQILDSAVENWSPVNINLKNNVIKFILIGEILVCGFVLIGYIFIEEPKKKINS